MGDIFNKLKDIDKKLQSSADKLNIRWYIVYPAIFILSIEVIVAIFVGFSYVWDIAHPDYLIMARYDFLPASDYTLYGRTEKTGSHFELWDLCGNRLMLHILIPKEIEQKKHSSFFQVGQVPLTYPISYIADKKDGIMNLHIYSTETKFSIDTERSAIKGISESKNVVGIHEKEMGIDLRGFIENQQFLFEIIPEKDGKVNIDCYGDRKCKVLEVKYTMLSIPKSYDAFNISQEKVTTVYLPRPNFNKATIYSINAETGGIADITSETPTGSKIEMTKNKCVPDGVIYRKAGLI